MDNFINLNWQSVLNGLLVLVIVLVLDLIFGVILSLSKKTFTWAKLAQFTSTNLPKIFAWLVVKLLSGLPADLIPKDYAFLFTGFATLVYLTIMLSFLGSIFGKLRDAGVMPDSKLLDAVGLKGNAEKG